MDNEVYCNTTSKTTDIDIRLVYFPVLVQAFGRDGSIASFLPARLSLKTAEEINEKMNRLKVEERVPVTNGIFEDRLDFETPPSVDWRTHGLVSPVQNQVGCC